jgi:hypothetical protein
MTDALNWKPAGTPKAEPIEGRFIRLEKLDPARHGDDLWEVLQGPASDPVLWDYLPYGPFAERAASTVGWKATPPAATRCSTA